MQNYLLINIALQLAGKWERCEVVLQELQHSGKVSLLFSPFNKGHPLPTVWAYIYFFHLCLIDSTVVMFSTESVTKSALLWSCGITVRFRTASLSCHLSKPCVCWALSWERATCWPRQRGWQIFNYADRMGVVGDWTVSGDCSDWGRVSQTASNSPAVLPGVAFVHREWLFRDELREVGSLGGSCDLWMPCSEVPACAEPVASWFDTWEGPYE